MGSIQQGSTLKKTQEEKKSTFKEELSLEAIMLSSLSSRRCAVVEEDEDDDDDDWASDNEEWGEPEMEEKKKVSVEAISSSKSGMFSLGDSKISSTRSNGNFISIEKKIPKKDVIQIEKEEEEEEEELFGGLFGDDSDDKFDQRKEKMIEQIENLDFEYHHDKKLSSVSSSSSSSETDEEKYLGWRFDDDSGSLDDSSENSSSFLGNLLHKKDEKEEKSSSITLYGNHDQQEKSFLGSMAHIAKSIESGKQKLDLFIYDLLEEIFNLQQNDGFWFLTEFLASLFRTSVTQIKKRIFSVIAMQDNLSEIDEDSGEVDLEDFAEEVSEIEKENLFAKKTIDWKNECISSFLISLVSQLVYYLRESVLLGKPSKIESKKWDSSLKVANNWIKERSRNNLTGVSECYDVDMFWGPVARNFLLWECAFNSLNHFN